MREVFPARGSQRQHRGQSAMSRACGRCSAPAIVR